MRGGAPIHNTEVSILVVDDEPANNELAERALHGRPGYRLQTTTSARQALATMEEMAFDVLIVDLSMPDMDGLEFVSRVRATNTAVPIVMLTAFPDLQGVLEAKAQGLIQLVVTKPWRAEDLPSAVEHVLAMAKMRAAVQTMLGGPTSGTKPPPSSAG